MSIAKIEGFQYQLDIPRPEAWQRFCDFMYKQDRKNALPLIRSSFIGKDKYGFAVIKGMTKTKSTTCVVCTKIDEESGGTFWRSVLHPVTKDGQPDPHFKSMRDGTLVHGGTIYLDNEPVHITAEGRPFDTICIGETDPIGVLSWYVFEGDLYSKDLLAENVTPALLRECDLI